MVERVTSEAQVDGSIPSPNSKENMQELRDITAGKTSNDSVSETSKFEIPLCHKTWWEEGVQYECLMDKFHKNPKHGQHGMVQRLEE